MHLTTGDTQSTKFEKESTSHYRETCREENAASSSHVWQIGVNLDRSAGRPVSTEKTKKVSDKDWPHNFQRSDRAHLEQVFLNLRQKIGRKPEDEMLDINVNALMWGMFMSATMDAAVHLGKFHQDNLQSVKNTKERHLKKLFDV